MRKYLTSNVKNVSSGLGADRRTLLRKSQLLQVDRKIRDSEKYGYSYDKLYNACTSGRQSYCNGN